MAKSRSAATADRQGASFKVEAPRWWRAELDTFLKRHPDWGSRLAAVEPVYGLPSAAVEALVSRRRPLLDPPRAAAERDFNDLLARSVAIGVWQNAPVRYPFLAPRPPRPDPAAFPGLNWTASQVAQIGTLLGRADDYAERLKGYAGWLVTEPQFLAERDRLRSAWQSLAPGQRPAPPLGRLLEVPRPGRPLREFGRSLGSFLERWGLTEMATWDLPQPQGPLLPNLLPPGAPADPTHGVRISLPAHFPVAGADNLTRAVRQLQAQAAADAGLTAEAAGLPHHQSYARMLEAAHLEHVIRTRIPDPPPQGLAGAIIAAIAGHLGCGEDAVRKYRKAIARCRRGERQKISWLRPKAGCP
jgi:hypothetical protein